MLCQHRTGFARCYLFQVLLLRVHRAFPMSIPAYNGETVASALPVGCFLQSTVLLSRFRPVEVRPMFIFLCYGDNVLCNSKMYSSPAYTHGLKSARCLTPLPGRRLCVDAITIALTEAYSGEGPRNSYNSRRYSCAWLVAVSAPCM